MMFLAEGDANMRFFHLQACHRSRKNHITSLRVQGNDLVLNEQMADAVYDHYNGMLGTPFHRVTTVNVDTLGIVQHDLSISTSASLSLRFGRPSRSCRRTKLRGRTASLGCSTKWRGRSSSKTSSTFFWSLDGRSFNLINDAFMILLRKKNEAQEIRDYRPISLLMHSFGKLIAKCLARRLALVLNDLVHLCQSAFI
jgi:hypothetical protein